MRNLVTEVEEEPAPELGEVHITCCIALPFLLISLVIILKSINLFQNKKSYVLAMPRSYSLFGYNFT